MGEAAFKELRTRLAEIADIRKARSLLSWDESVMMPPGGAGLRAEQLGTLSRIAHDKFTAAETGRLLDEARPWAEQQDYDSFEASLVRVVTVDWEKARRVPTDLQAERARASSLAYPIWVEARKNNDFKAFLAPLRENLDLTKRYVECFDPGDEPYDVLLDDYERGMKTAEVRRLFDYLKEHQAPLVKELAWSPDHPPHDFSLEAQKTFELEVVRAFGFDDECWRLDPTVHPFASGTGVTDIRITTRYFKEHLGGLFGTMHEFGHGLYERQIEPSMERSPLARGVSLGMHESQSRMWENFVGRSRPFWNHFFPRAQELFGSTLDGYDVERWYREVNTVEPSLIRVEADEATYNLHIILRFELEQELISDAFPLEQLPEEWNRRMSEYLGIDVPDDTQGVLQDVHWSGGSFGYFSTYALGNLISAQIWEKVLADIPDVDASIEAGEFAPLRDWLREHLHGYGRKFTPAETLERVVGTREIDPEPYVRYLRAKLSA
ncbi:MAG TPA: carboxypeptidase M32 [Gaiellaceae bacterium]